MPFWQKTAIPKQKNWFSVPNIKILGSKLHFFVPSGPILTLAQERPNLAKNSQIWPKTCISRHYGPSTSLSVHLVPCLTKNVNDVPRWFSDMWVSKLLLPPKIIRMFGSKYAFVGTYRPCRLIRCLVGWLVGGCGARAVSRRTHIYFI